jgi:hypothetical protein
MYLLVQVQLVLFKVKSLMGESAAETMNRCFDHCH